MKSLCNQYGLLTIAVPRTGMESDIRIEAYVSMLSE